jgi:hypothetical protein
MKLVVAEAEKALLVQLVEVELQVPEEPEKQIQ